MSTTSSGPTSVRDHLARGRTEPVGEAVFWLDGSGIQAPFTSTDGTFGTQIELLYGWPSAIAPGDVISSPSVGGQERPRPGGNPEWTRWFRLTPRGITADAAQMSWTYPAIYRVSSQRRQAPTVAGVIFQAREINPNTGEAIGPEFVLHNSSEGATALTTAPLHRPVRARDPTRPHRRLRRRRSPARVHPAGLHADLAIWEVSALPFDGGLPTPFGG
jgi:hypothetical protein